MSSLLPQDHKPLCRFTFAFGRHCRTTGHGPIAARFCGSPTRTEPPIIVAGRI
jgi:hypothetical protein